VIAITSVFHLFPMFHKVTPLTGSLILSRLVINVESSVILRYSFALSPCNYWDFTSGTIYA